jgi:hypothetical protein
MIDLRFLYGLEIIGFKKPGFQDFSRPGAILELPAKKRKQTQ